MNKYAFISDIHGNILALEAVMDDILNRGIPTENVYCLGDLVGYGPNPNEVIDYIRENNIKTIMGNYDEAVGFYLPSCGCKIDSPIEKEWMMNSLQVSSKLTTERNKAYLREFDEKMELNINGYNVLLVHASPFSITDYIFENSEESQQSIADEVLADVIIFGHTHFPYIKKLRSKYFVNAGSVGRPKDKDNRAGYVIADFLDNIHFELHRVEYDVFEVKKRIKDSDLLDVFGDAILCGCTSFEYADRNITDCRCDLLTDIEHN